MGRRIRKAAMMGSLVVVVLFLGLVFVSLTGGFGLLELGFTLVVGWLKFLERTLPRIQWNFDLIAMGVVCVAAVLGLGQAFLNGLTRSISEKRGNGWRWHWKWTWCGACGVAVLFLVGMAVGGVVHQLGWIASSPERMMERKGKRHEARYNIKQLDISFRIELNDAGDNLSVARQAMRQPDRQVVRLLQDVHFLLIVNKSGIMEGYVLFPRDPVQFEDYGGFYFAEETEKWLSREQMQQLLQKHRDNLEPL